MENPLSTLLPSAFHFLSLNGSQLMLLVGIMMFFGSFGGRIFQKLKIPQVVGYIVIGIIIGVSGFQILGKDTVAALNPISTASLSLIGFLVGAELKIEVIKKYGKQFVGILIGESITPFFVVGILTGSVTYLFTKSIPHSVAFGLLLGAICAATAPAATTDVLKEFRTKGPLTTTILGIVAMDDAVALILYAIAATISAPLLGGHSVSFIAQLGAIAYDIFGSIIMGMVFGFLLNLILKNIMNNEGRVLGFALGSLFLCTGVCSALHLDNILASMFIGFFMTNFAHPKTNAMFRLVEKFTPPIYVLFFVTVGAKLNIWIVTPFIALIAILYVGGRTIGKTIGSRLGARITHAPDSVRKYLPFCLLSQAGVAIGLSIAAGNDFQDSVGPQIMLIITATTFIVQILGPIFVKYGVTKAGEVGLNVTAEDLMKSTKVSDVCVEGCPLCGKESYTIVNDTDTVGKIIQDFTHHANMNYEVRSNEKENRGKLIGQISIVHLKEAMQIGEMGENLLAMDVMEKAKITCKPETSLPEAYQLFTDYDTDSVCIVNEENEPLGMLEKFTADHYIHTKIVELEHKLAKMEK
ncbi:MAG: cation:proton antiporter [Treponema sp.]|nr:cation:proton antiporter [Treponema sp.]